MLIVVVLLVVVYLADGHLYCHLIVLHEGDQEVAKVQVAEKVPMPVALETLMNYWPVSIIITNYFLIAFMETVYPTHCYMLINITESNKK
jgi:hypothetical protein